jgi:hypothetical protein
MFCFVECSLRMAAHRVRICLAPKRNDRGVSALFHRAGAMAGSRGQEKRRHLLAYLRTHLEELRPSSPPPKHILHNKVDV